jgi:mRNA interferase MazF
MITSAENRSWPDDVPLGAFYKEAGLPAPSVIRPCKIATIDARYAERLGRIQPKIRVEVETAVRRMLGIPL